MNETYVQTPKVTPGRKPRGEWKSYLFASLIGFVGVAGCGGREEAKDEKATIDSPMPTPEKVPPLVTPEAKPGEAKTDAVPPAPDTPKAADDKPAVIEKPTDATAAPADKPKEEMPPK